MDKFLYDRISNLYWQLKKPYYANITSVDGWGYISSIPQPTLSAPDSAYQNSTINVTITNYDSNLTYFVSVTGGSFTGPDDNGIIQWTLPSIENQSRNHIIRVYAKNSEGQVSAPSFKYIRVTCMEPVQLSGPSTASELSTIKIYINNYNSSLTYSAQVSSGSVSSLQHDSTGYYFNWTLPEEPDDSHSLETIKVTSSSDTCSDTVIFKVDVKDTWFVTNECILNSLIVGYPICVVIPEQNTKKCKECILIFEDV